MLMTLFHSQTRCHMIETILYTVVVNGCFKNKNRKRKTFDCLYCIKDCVTYLALIPDEHPEQLS